MQEEHSEEYTELKKISIAKLKERCKERDEKIGGKKEELISCLRKPRMPDILIMRVRLALRLSLVILYAEIDVLTFLAICLSPDEKNMFRKYHPAMRH